MITVYIDMDGVVCDWYGHIGERTFDKAWFHEFIEGGGFAKLKALGDLDLLKDTISSFPEFRFCFLSSCGGVEEPHATMAKTQKRAWLDEHGFGEYPLICVAHKGKKKDFATPNSILIDDTNSNCTDFVQNNGLSVKTESTIGYNKFTEIDLLNKILLIIELYTEMYYK